MSDVVAANNNVLKFNTTKLLSKFYQSTDNQVLKEIDIVLNIPDKMKLMVEPSLIQMFR